MLTKFSYARVAACSDGRVDSVTLTNVACYAALLDQKIEVGEVELEVGEAIKAAADEQLSVQHPDNPEFNKIVFTEFVLPIETVGAEPTGRNTVVISPGKLDRSPCGTGTCARMAVMHAKGELNVGDGFVSRSVINSRFDGRIESETTLSDGTRAILPSIKGRAWISGFHSYVLDPRDPWPQGYTLSDTWYRALD